MSGTSGGKGARTARLRALCAVLLALSVLTPKVSLAVSALFGDGYRSVVVCTGGGLKRVTIGPDGGIVDDVSKAWAGSHCVLVEDDVVALARRWSTLRRPVLRDPGLPATPAPSLAPRERQPAVSSRGPPLV